MGWKREDSLTSDALSQLESLLESTEAQEFVSHIGTTMEALRRMVVRVALQAADERGGKVERRDILDAWERVTEWGNLALWRSELKKGMESI